MNLDHDEFARKIKGYLDAGAAGMRAGTVYKLSQARARAMANLAPDPARATESQLAHALPGRNAGSAGSAGNLRRGAWFGFGILLLVAAAFGYQQWRFYQQTSEIEEIDVQILTSDLPIDAYVDRGFQTWLTSDKR